jgi:hypothetical protein
MIPNINIITKVAKKFQWKIENMYDPKIVKSTSTTAKPINRNEWTPSPTLPVYFYTDINSFIIRNI